LVAEIFVSLCLLTGTAMVLLGSLGLIRMPDVYNMMQASTLATTLGTALVVLAGTVYFSVTHGLTLKLLLIIPFLFFTASTGSLVVARGAHRIGVPLASVSVRDDLQEDAGTASQQE